MRWLYLYVTHDPRGNLPSDIHPTRTETTDLSPIRPGAFARWAASTTIPAQPTAPSARPARLRLAGQLR